MTEALFDYTSAPSAITHSLEYYVSLSFSFVSPADEVGGGPARRSVTIIYDDSDPQSTSVTYEGDFHSRESSVSSFLPRGGATFAVSDNLAFVAQINVTASQFPDITSYVNGSYHSSELGALVAAFKRYIADAEDWYHDVQDLKLTSITLSNRDTGALIGKLTLSDETSLRELVDLYPTMDATILGSKFDDTIIAANGENIISGNDGEDKITGGSSKDAIDGGDDKDTIDGGDGNNTYIGSDGNDDITGGQDKDTFDFKEGFSTFTAGTLQTLNGKGGEDEVLLTGSRGLYRIETTIGNSWETTTTEISIGGTDLSP